MQRKGALETLGDGLDIRRSQAGVGGVGREKEPEEFFSVCLGDLRAGRRGHLGDVGL